MRRLRNSTAIRYISLSVEIVLLAGLIVGIIIYTPSVKAILEKEKSNLYDKAAALAQDMDSQYNAMRNVLLKISSDPSYRTSYLSMGTHYEYEMLASFRKYTGYTTLSDNYFLVYKNNPWVYRSSGTKSSMDIYLNSIGVYDHQTEIEQGIRNVNEFSIISDHDGSHMFFVLPFDSHISDSEKMTLVFFVQPSAFNKRLDLLCGSFTGKVVLNYEGKPFAVIGPSDEEEYNTVLSATYNSFCADFYVNNSQLSLGLLTSGTTARFLIVSAVLLLCCLGMLLGYVLYRPIQRLFRQYGAKSSDHDEIYNIEIAFSDLLREKEYAEANIRQQYRLIKEYFLKLLLSDGTHYGYLLNHSFVGVSLPGPYYGVLAMSFDDRLSESKQEKISNQIEELSDDDIHLYFCSTNTEDIYAVLLSISDSNQIDEAKAYIESLLDDCPGLSIGVSPLFREASHFKKALHQAVAALEMKRTESSADEYDSIYLHDATIDSIITDLRCGTTQKGKLLITLLDDIHSKVNAFLKERYFYDQILAKIISGLGVKESDPQVAWFINALLQAEDYDTFRDLIVGSIHLLQSSVSKNEKTEEIEAMQKRKGKVDPREILVYIQQHYSLPDISLDLLTDHFGLSTRYISNLIRQETGVTYKTYLTELRMNRARNLLLDESLTITEVSQRVGYINLPLFIKTFKRFFGISPSTYRELSQKGEISNEIGHQIE